MRTPRAFWAYVFQGVITKRILEEKYQTLAELKRGWKPSKFKGFRPFLFLKITFPRRIKGLRIQHNTGKNYTASKQRKPMAVYLNPPSVSILFVEQFLRQKITSILFANFALCS